ncbi:hypothetical protein TWF481_000227 [Arthrobotrys musiformis]|uniref:Uncharacterized protein n=1 Tax=Arthrobotrys musiformis TaxID=47236 RepID=A0AAV9WSS3_9PEZI
MPQALITRSRTADSRMEFPIAIILKWHDPPRTTPKPPRFLSPWSLNTEQQLHIANVPCDGSLLLALREKVKAKVVYLHRRCKFSKFASLEQYSLGLGMVAE